MKTTIVFKKDLNKSVIFQGPIRVSRKDGMYIIAMPQVTLKYPLCTIQEIAEEDTIIMWGGAAVAREAHNLKVVGSNPTPATSNKN